MRRVKIIAAGSLKENYFREGESYYAKALRKICDLKIIEVADEKAPEGLSPPARQAIKEREGDRILRRVDPKDTVCALAVEGKKLDAAFLPMMLETANAAGAASATGAAVFVIGGSLGLGRNVMRRADFSLSFSPMTFPHQLTRLILLEWLTTAITADFARYNFCKTRSSMLQ
jgi:23S rRNA (pseudouridine1915-N3)-methyltransferase